MNDTDLIKDYKKILLFVFPVIYLILGFYFRQVFGALSLRSVDPDYTHFLSGLCVSAGKFNLANIDHPASALHLLLAGIYRIVYIFRSHNVPYFQDVISHSDMYLAIGNLVITLAIAGFMLWAGRAVLKISKNLFYAVSIQTAPFLMNIWYDLTGRIYVELLFVVPVFILEVLILQDIYQPEKQTDRHIFSYGLAVGLGLSLKMTFLPLFILPLFIVKGLNSKIKYLLSVIVSFFLLSLPVLFQLKKFLNWMLSLFLHSGVYQSGAKTVINGGAFFKNVKELVASQHDFFYALILLVVLFLILLFFKRLRNILLRVDLGIIIALLGMVFITCKQYEIRYFIPALLLFPFLLVLVIEHVTVFRDSKEIELILGILLVIVVVFKFQSEVPYIRVVSKNIGSQMAARIQTRDVVKALPEDSYKIIVSQDYGCPFQAYAIMYSFCMAGQGWPGYREKLNKIYPDTYQYFTWSDELKYWGKPFDPVSVMASGKPVYLYLQKMTPELYNRTIRKLFVNEKEISVTKELIYENPSNGEAILQLFLARSH